MKGGRKMDVKAILRAVDHTLLAPAARWEEIRALCEDAVRYGTASVCIPASYVARASAFLEGRLPVCTVIGFPNGYDTTASKVFQAKDAIGNGAEEIDMVVNLGWVKDGLYDEVLDELRAVKEACGSHVLKVIVEACLLTQAEKLRLCDLITRSGADFIKTSTGFSTGGATFEDVALFRAHVGPQVRVKAAGGISTLADAARFLELGADRLGTSRVVRRVKEAECGGHQA